MGRTTLHFSTLCSTTWVEDIFKIMCFPKQLTQSHLTTLSPFSGSLQGKMQTEIDLLIRPDLRDLLKGPGKEYGFFFIFCVMLTLSHYDLFTLVFRVQCSRRELECWEPSVSKADGKKSKTPQQGEWLRNFYIQVGMQATTAYKAVLCKEPWWKDLLVRNGLIFLTHPFASWTICNANNIKLCI